MMMLFVCSILSLVQNTRFLTKNQITNLFHPTMSLNLIQNLLTRCEE
uniref:Uncharacterized protein n=1 Tax=Arundo donax TaxID=35708 RepID=A0A0A9ED56_ARUDO